MWTLSYRILQIPEKYEGSSKYNSVLITFSVVAILYEFLAYQLPAPDNDEKHVQFLYAAGFQILVNIGKIIIEPVEAVVLTQHIRKNQFEFIPFNTGSLVMPVGISGFAGGIWRIIGDINYA